VLKVYKFQICLFTPPPSRRLSDTEKNQLQFNKTHDPEYMEFISSMQESRILRHCIMDYVSEMHGGPESVPITAHDMYKL
jgi:hypothetical protein